jgi:hypothetical protein
MQIWKDSLLTVKFENLPRLVGASNFDGTDVVSASEDVEPSGLRSLKQSFN